MNDLLEKVRKEEDFKSIQEGVQLIKPFGYIEEKEINANSSGTALQYIQFTIINKEGKKEPKQFIKEIRGEPKGLPSISYYRFPINV